MFLSFLQIALEIIKQVYKQDGLRGFYRGYFASICTYVPNSALWWSFYHFYQGKAQLNTISQLTISIFRHSIFPNCCYLIIESHASLFCQVYAALKGFMTANSVKNGLVNSDVFVLVAERCLKQWHPLYAGHSFSPFS